MKAITLRNLPPDLVRQLERKAGREGLSLNRAVIAALEELFGVGRKKARPAYGDLDFVVGSLTKEDADALDRSVRSRRKIDREVWS